jgi:hypothetical protein
VIDNVGVSVRAQPNSQGRSMDVIIDEAVSKRVRSGGPTRNAMRDVFGVTMQPVKR